MKIAIPFSDMVYQDESLGSVSRKIEGNYLILGYKLWHSDSIFDVDKKNIDFSRYQDRIIQMVTRGLGEDDAPNMIGLQQLL